MHDAENDFGLGHFTGTLPLFPLPGVVLFPCSLLPLHIFEPRYRTMVAEAAARDGCIGMVMLRPGWEKSYYENPAIHDVACLGKIVELERHQDGRFDIVLCGVKRARIEAIVSDKPYRTARVELVEDLDITARDGEAEGLRDRLLELADIVPMTQYRHKNLARALRKLDAPLGTTADLMADSLLIKPATKQALLEERCPFTRAESLVVAVEQELKVVRHEVIGAGRRFPPSPSLN